MSTIPPLFEDLRDPAPLSPIRFVEAMAELLERTCALAGVCHEASQGENPTWADIRDALGILHEYAFSAQALFERWHAERYPGDHIHACPHCEAPDHD